MCFKLTHWFQHRDLTWLLLLGGSYLSGKKRKTERPMKLLIKLRLLKDESDMKSVNLISLSNVLQLAMHSVRWLRQKTLLFSVQCQNMPLSMKSNMVGLTKEKTQVYTSTETNCCQEVALIRLVKLLATLCSSGSKNQYHVTLHVSFVSSSFVPHPVTYTLTATLLLSVLPAGFSPPLLLSSTFRLCSQNKVKYHASRRAFVFMF